MSRFVTILLLLAVISCAYAAPQRVDAQQGSIAVGSVSGGTFGNDAFSKDHGGNVYPGNGGNGWNGAGGNGANGPPC